MFYAIEVATITRLQLYYSLVCILLRLLLVWIQYTLYISTMHTS